MSKDKFRLKFSVYLIPRIGEKVLLSLRENTGFMDGYYSFVSGHVEENETAEEALIRETSEEAGVKVAEQDLKFVFAEHRLSDEIQDDYVELFFETSKWQGEFTNKEPQKCGGLEWFNINQLPENTIPYIADVLRLYPSGKRYMSRRKALA
jgi:8-oxo-dGTP pyrophosphatase MutT (NUDIX family)